MFKSDTNLIILTIHCQLYVIRFVNDTFKYSCVNTMKNLNISEILNPLLEEVAEIAGYLWQREWIERNGGNISIDVTEQFRGSTFENDLHFEKADFPKEAANMYLYITGANCHLRKLIDTIEDVSCVLYINDTADAYAVIWGGYKSDFRPTSEMASHLTIHVYNKLHNPNNKVVLHAHPSELIVLSHHDIFKDEDKLNETVWKMCPEVRVYIPNGIGCVPYAITQSDELAYNTIEAFKNRDVALWEKHGATVTAPTLEEAWDFMDVANKGAKLLLMSWSSGFKPEGIFKEDIQALETLFNL